MKLLQVIRSHEWWEYKLPPLLALSFATTLMAGIPLVRVIGWLLFLLLSIITGAIYVSVINDITDIEEDLASGKKNRIASVPEKYRWLIPAGCILAGLVFLYFLYPDWLSCLLYFLPWVSFSLYSFEPFRLKRRGGWGVLADACGSHLFTSLYIITSTSYFIGINLNWVWFGTISIWAFIVGLRGILWHQFFDRANDAKINLATYATQVNPFSFKHKETLIMLIEIVSLLSILFQIEGVLPILFLIFYLCLMLLRQKWLGYRICIILAPTDQPFQILLLDYYRLFLPVSLILSSIFANAADVSVLLLFFLLFPNGARNVAKDIRYILSSKFAKKNV